MNDSRREEELLARVAALEAGLAEARQQAVRYHDLFRTAPIAYLATDIDGTIRDLNDAATVLLQIDGPLAAGAPLAGFLARGDPLDAVARRLAAGEAVAPFDHRIVPRGGGEQVPVRFTVRAAVDESGETELHWGLFDLRAEHAAHSRERDRDRQLQRARAGRAAQERIAARARHVSEASVRLLGLLDPAEVWETAASILRDGAIGIALLEPETGGRLLVRAISGERSWLGRFEALVGTTLELASAASSVGIPMQRLALTLRHGEPEVVHGGDGEHTRLLVPLRSRDATRGVAVLWLPSEVNVAEELLVARTIADRVALALQTADLFQEVILARRRAEEASAMESDFLSVVSHELRTPLTAIVSYAELLSERAQELPPKLGRYARQIADAADHQRRLVEQILSYKRLQSGEDDLVTEELDYRKPAEFALSMARPLARDKPVRMELEMPDAPVRGVCDPGRVRQILANLLTNAIRHTDEGFVRLTVEASDDSVRFRVQDTGEGIPAPDIARLFNRFWRGSRSAGRGGGSGLGLTITHALVTRMHGDIDVASEVGRGTTVTVRLPRKVAGDDGRATSPGSPPPGPGG